MGDHLDESMELDEEDPPRQHDAQEGQLARSLRPPAPDSTTESTDFSAGAPAIPSTPGGNHLRRTDFPPPKHWVERPATIVTRHPIPPYENLRVRVRLDWLILFDLRLWKKARTSLRDLYISTVVGIPDFKRILGLRFSSLYTALSQLYLIADREPDHSIINLSLQIITAPSITAEVVKKGNFLTSLMAILYTFLTTRQVGYPTDINPKATLAFEAGSLANRRMHHFFSDMRYLVGSEYVKERLRIEERYILQFLDLVRLHQGICPNIRALDQHLEYEAEAWISASLITREINKLVRQFSEAFRFGNGPDTPGLRRSISTAVRYAVIDSMGFDKDRYSVTEVKGEAEFKTTVPYVFDTDEAGNERKYEILHFRIDYQPLSFHHPLHYTLSWLIEAGKSMTVEELRQLLMISWDDVQAWTSPDSKKRKSDDLVLAMFDYPLRVCAWLCEMKVGMWVRNGFSLRHQMQTYRGVSQKDLTHNRDIFLLQTALVTLDPSRVLANMIDRFNLDNWVRGNPNAPPPWDDVQTLDMAEEFLNLLILILSERLCLIPQSEQPDLLVAQLKKELIHILCFKPLTFSELCNPLPDRLKEHDDFQEILAEMTIYNPPSGLSDSGTFELKEKYLLELDPYVAQFTKNQREEAEGIYKTRMARILGKPKDEVVFEPKLQKINGGVFGGLAEFTRTPIFAQIVYYSLLYARDFDVKKYPILTMRVETFLQVCLHLCLLAVLEDSPNSEPSFILHALHKRAAGTSKEFRTIASTLYNLGKSETFKTLWPRIFLILKYMRQRRPAAFDAANSWAHELEQKKDEERNQEETDSERKKKLSRERQAKVMAEFKKQQEMFKMSAGMELDEDGLSDEDYSGESAGKCWDYPSGSCSVCKESVGADDRIYGTFAFITDSNLLRQTDLGDPDYFYEVAISSSNLDEPVSRPFGVASMNKAFVKKLAADGTEILAERQVLGRGFSPKNVRRGTYSTGCGHIIHFECFNHWYELTKRRLQHNIVRIPPERFEKKEFICPLCKALGNIFLPIIWRPKKETVVGVTHSGQSLRDWLSTTIGPLVSRLEKAAESGGNDRTAARAQELFYEYGKERMSMSIAQKVQGSIGSLDKRSTLHEGAREQSSYVFEVDELYRIYRRLRDTLRVNQISSRYGVYSSSEGNAELTHCDTLARILGFSISAAEIAQRGVDSEFSSTLIEKIPNQTLPHLRIIADTVFSYYAVGGLQSREQNVTLQQFKEMQDHQLHQLFIGHHQITEKSQHETQRIPSLFSQDIFVFLAECTVCLIPSLHIEFHQILQLCYIAEIVKTVIFMTHNFVPTYDKLDDTRKIRLEQVIASENYTKDQLDIFKQFINSLGHTNSTSNIPPAALAVFRNMVGKYATAFLRKATILAHVQYGVDFATKELPYPFDAPEQDRLSKALGLPSIEEIFSDCLSPSPGGTILRSMIGGWFRHWHYSGTIGEHMKARLTHPCIFELIGLPLHYDTLVEDAMKKKCPSTGKDLVDPCVCLFCGEIFCGQAVCCTKEKKGGCNQHMAKCQGNIGIFIAIRKCHVLFLHAGKGTWAQAPYLDKHGETDSGLRRNRQLFLNQRRYDALQRNLWLTHGIPSVISRKLEAENNPGGWETI